MMVNAAAPFELPAAYPADRVSRCAIASHWRPRGGAESERSNKSKRLLYCLDGLL
jgi:hypothetical protein